MDELSDLAEDFFGAQPMMLRTGHDSFCGDLFFEEVIGKRVVAIAINDEEMAVKLAITSKESKLFRQIEIFVHRTALEAANAAEHYEQMLGFST